MDLDLGQGPRRFALALALAGAAGALWPSRALAAADSHRAAENDSAAADVRGRIAPGTRRAFCPPR
eukprot:5163054-Lingulodinium_polyedra.AAC.1